MLIVVIVMGTAAVLGPAFIASTTPSRTSTRNMLYRARATYLAESGVEVAIHWLLSGDGSGVLWSGATGEQIDAGSDYYDVAVSATPNTYDQFLIDSNGYASADGATVKARRRIIAELFVPRPKTLVLDGSAHNVPAGVSVDGDVWATGAMSLYGEVTGNILTGGALTLAGGDVFNGGWLKENQTIPLNLPSFATLTYSNIPASTAYEGGKIKSKKFGVGIVSGTTIQDATLEPLDPNNPYNIIYHNQSRLDLVGDVTMNGTLIVTGDLYVWGKAEIRTQGPFPALVVGGNLIMAATGAELRTRGPTVIYGVFGPGFPVYDTRTEIRGTLFSRGGLNMLLGMNGHQVRVEYDSQYADMWIWNSDNAQLELYQTYTDPPELLSWQEQ